MKLRPDGKVCRTHGKKNFAEGARRKKIPECDAGQRTLKTGRPWGGRKKKELKNKPGNPEDLHLPRWQAREMVLGQKDTEGGIYAELSAHSKGSLSGKNNVDRGQGDVLTK